MIDLELYISGRLLKPWSQKIESVWPLKTTERGRVCKIPGSKPAERSKQDLSFQFAGPKLFNCFPKKLRNATHCTLEDVKEQLDEHLSFVPDEPKIGGLMLISRGQEGKYRYAQYLSYATFRSYVALLGAVQSQLP